MLPNFAEAASPRLFKTLGRGANRVDELVLDATHAWMSERQERVEQPA